MSIPSAFTALLGKDSIRRHLTNIPSSQQRLLDDQESWAQPLDNQPRRYIKVPSEALREIRDHHARLLQAQGSKHSGSKSPDDDGAGEGPISTPYQARQVQVPEHSERASGIDDGDEDTASVISGWEPSPPQQRPVKLAAHLSGGSSRQVSPLQASQALFQRQNPVTAVSPGVEFDTQVPVQSQSAPDVQGSSHARQQPEKPQPEKPQPGRGIKKPIVKRAVAVDLPSSSAEVEEDLEILAPVAMAKQVMNPAPPSAQVEVPCSLRSSANAPKEPSKRNQSERRQIISHDVEHDWVALARQPVNYEKAERAALPSERPSSKSLAAVRPARQARLPDSDMTVNSSPRASVEEHQEVHVVPGTNYEQTSPAKHVGGSLVTETPFKSRMQRDPRAVIESQRAASNSAVAPLACQLPSPQVLQYSSFQVLASIEPFLAPQGVDLAKTSGTSEAEAKPTSKPLAPFMLYSTTYPSYTGSLDDFINACVYIELLQQERQIASYQYDDLIRSFKEDYIPYVSSIFGAPDLSGLQIYVEKTNELLFRSNVVTKHTINGILEFYHEKASSARASCGLSPPQRGLLSRSQTRKDEPFNEQPAATQDEPIRPEAHTRPAKRFFSSAPTQDLLQTANMDDPSTLVVNAEEPQLRANKGHQILESTEEQTSDTIMDRTQDTNVEMSPAAVEKSALEMNKKRLRDFTEARPREINDDVPRDKHYRNSSPKRPRIANGAHSHNGFREVHSSPAKKGLTKSKALGLPDVVGSGSRDVGQPHDQGEGSGTPHQYEARLSRADLSPLTSPGRWASRDNTNLRRAVANDEVRRATISGQGSPQDFRKPAAEVRRSTGGISKKKRVYASKEEKDAARREHMMRWKRNKAAMVAAGQTPSSASSMVSGDVRRTAEP